MPVAQSKIQFWRFLNVNHFLALFTWFTRRATSIQLNGENWENHWQTEDLCHRRRWIDRDSGLPQASSKVVCMTRSPQAWCNGQCCWQYCTSSNHFSWVSIAKSMLFSQCMIKSFAKEAVLAASLILSTYNLLQLEKVLPRSHGGPNAKKPGRLPGPDLGKGSAMIYPHPLHVPSHLQVPSRSIVFSDKPTSAHESFWIV